MKPLELATENDLIQVNTAKKPELMFTSHEKVVMKEVVQILEPFEEATNLTQGNQYTYVLVRLVIPAVVGLQKKHLLKLKFVISNQL